MKRFLTFLLVICLFVPCTILLSGCDLSHKHYYNDIGKCNCNHSISKALTFDSQTKEYSTTDNVVNGYEGSKVNYFYYNFTTTESLPYGIEFVVEGNDNVSFDRIDMYYNAAYHIGVANDLYGTVTYNKSIEANKQMFLKVIFEGSGNITFTIKPILTPSENPNL